MNCRDASHTVFSYIRLSDFSSRELLVALYNADENRSRFVYFYSYISREQWTIRFDFVISLLFNYFVIKKWFIKYIYTEIFKPYTAHQYLWNPYCLKRSWWAIIESLTVYGAPAASSPYVETPRSPLRWRMYHDFSEGVLFFFSFLPISLNTLISGSVTRATCLYM